MVAQTRSKTRAPQDQDDVLLKNDVEARASLESLAGMTEIENSKENKCFSEKRKSISVRQQNYAKKKRNCTHSSEEKTDGAEKLPSIADLTQTGEVSDKNGFRGGKAALNLMIPDRGASFQSHGHSSAPSDSPLWTPIEGFSTPKFPDMGTCESYVSVTNELGYNMGLSEVKPENQLLCGAMRNSASRTDDYVAEPSNSPFDYTNEEQLMASDGNAIDMDYIDDFSSLLLDSPSQNGMPATEAMAPANDCSKNSDSACWVQERSNSLTPEYCVLNTEDREIPCNDDVFLLTGPLLSKIAIPSEMQWQIYEPPSLGQKVNACDPNERMSERNSLEAQNPVTIRNEETLQAEEDPYNSDVEIMI